VWGGHAAHVLECVPSKVAMLTLEWAPLAGLTVGLGFDALTLPP
jgi:hypothetical protein